MPAGSSQSLYMSPSTINSVPPPSSLSSTDLVFPPASDSMPIAQWKVFLSQRQCKMHSLTLVASKLWNWKWRPCIKMECGSLFRYRLVNRLFIANGFTLLSLILMAQLNG
ncbi:uncharacterized protein LOC133862575 [Alnus glutinosa]|uniref:uncharacterized protein LOC133862575 n=1 Tax=Alnus glutinosa TaxID=3517 RepID=UPI002D7810F3|nr:uncharacterized protein LOC133862575 [Alnus glutinosa]